MVPPEWLIKPRKGSGPHTKPTHVNMGSTDLTAEPAMNRIFADIVRDDLTSPPWEINL